MSRLTSHSFRSIVLAAAAVAGLSAAPRPADAQLMGRLKKAAAGAVADRAADAAARRVLGDSAAAPADAAAPAGGAAASRSGSTPAAAASRGPDKLDITSARIDTFIVAMRPLVVAARERQAFVDLQKKEQEWQECRGRAIQESTAAMMSGDRSKLPSPAAQKQIDAYLDHNSKLSEQMVAAMQAGQMERQQQLADSMMVINEKAQALQYPAIGTQCGQKVVAPKAPAGELREDGSIASTVGPDRAATGGWSPTQFGRLRERIALYLVAPDKATDLSADERAAIDARRADLASYAAAFTAGTMEWKSWGDVWTAWRSAR